MHGDDPSTRQPGIPDRVAAALPVLQAQLSPDRLALFQGFTDDPRIFMQEVLGAYIRGEIELTPTLLRYVLTIEENQRPSSATGDSPVAPDLSTVSDGTGPRSLDQWPPGPPRRRALRRSGLPVRLDDFSPDEQRERWGIEKPPHPRPRYD